MNTRRLNPPPAVAALLPALACLVTGLSDRLYIDIDNFWVSVVTSGGFGVDAYLADVNPLLCLVLQPLNALLPSADCFALLSRILLTLAVWWVGVLLGYAIPQRGRRWACLLGLTVLLLFHSLYNKNYTVHSALFAAVGCMTLAVGLRVPLPRGSGWFGAFWLLAGLVWRLNGALLVLPFLVLDLAVLLLFCHTPPRRVLRALLPYLLAGLGLLAFTAGFYALHPAEAEGLAYKAARSTLTDFPTKPWEEIAEQMTALGVSGNDYILMQRGSLLDSDFMTTETLQAVAELAADTQYHLTPGEIPALLAELAGCFGTQWAAGLGGLALLLFALLLGSAAPRPAKLEAAALGGATLMLLYFLYRGRLPEHVIVSILLACLGLLLPLWATAPARGGRALVWLRRGACLALAGAAALTLWQNRYHYGVYQPASLARAQTEEESLIPADEPDALLLWESMPLALYLTEHYLDAGHLPSQNFLQHNAPYGEWISGQPYFTRYLAALGAANPAKALLERPHTYLVTHKIAELEEYLQAHFGGDLHFEQVGFVEIFSLGDVPVRRIA